MTDSFVLVAAVLAALSIGLAIAAAVWWMSVRGQAGVAAATRKPMLLMVVAGGLLASVGVLYAVGDGAAGSKPASATVAAGATPALSALAASLNQGGASAAVSAVPASPKGGDLDVMTERLAKRLRERTPDDHEGWALLARSYVELGRDADAVAAFERSGPLLKSDIALKAELDTVKSRVAGGPAKSGATAATAGTAATASAAAPAPAASTAVAAAGAPVLSGTVDVSPALKSKLPATGFIFIIARAEGQAGAPLAAKRIAMTALPMRFALTDADSMLPGQKLSAAKTVALSARVSETGDAAPSPGALESARETIAVGRKDVALVLTTRRE